jgi:hypothetical protein
MNGSMKIERSVTLGLIMTLVIQIAVGMMWVGGTEARLAELERELESSWRISERLARLEGETAFMRQSLLRIEQSLINDN